MSIAPRPRALPVLAFALALAAGPSALAQAPKMVPDKAEELVKKKADDDPDGWYRLLKIGATFAMATNDSVVGKPDGASYTIGTAIAGNADLKSGKNDWRNTLTIDETFTRTPVVDEFVKTTDRLFLETLWNYRIVEVFGPFARASLETSLFKSIDVRPADVTYTIARPEGPDTVVDSRLALTDPFQPLLLKESAGLFLRPVATDPATVDVRAGAGAHQAFAEGALAVADDAATPEVDVKVLESYVQAGLELGAALRGNLEEGKVTYEARADVLIPFLDDAAEDDDRSAFELADMSFQARISFKLVDWASLDYEFKALKQPRLVDDWQVSNNLLLTIGLALSGEPERVAAAPEAAPAVPPGATTPPPGEIPGEVPGAPPEGTTPPEEGTTPPEEGTTPE